MPSASVRVNSPTDSDFQHVRLYPTGRVGRLPFVTRDPFRVNELAGITGLASLAGAVLDDDQLADLAAIAVRELGVTVRPTAPAPR